MVGPEVRRLADELAIMQTVSRLARASDDRDFKSYRACLADLITIGGSWPSAPDWTPRTMSGDEWTEIAQSRLARFDATHHHPCNYLIDIDGDEARCGADVVVMLQFDDHGSVETLTIVGRYDLRLRRDSEFWRLTERTLTPRFQVGDPSLMRRAEARGARRSS